MAVLFDFVEPSSDEDDTTWTSLGGSMSFLTSLRSLSLRWGGTPHPLLLDDEVEVPCVLAVADVDGTG